MKPESLDFTGFSDFRTSFPLDGGDGLFGDVPGDSVDAGDGRDDAVADRAEGGEGDLRHGRGDGVDGVDRADHDDPAHVALAVLLPVVFPLPLYVQSSFLISLMYSSSEPQHPPM